MSSADALRGREIVCVGFADWDASPWTNQQHLMSRLAPENRVLFVESLGLRRPQLAGRDLSRMVNRLRRALGGPRRADGLDVLSPLVVPLHSRRPVRALNRLLLRGQVLRATRRIGMARPILWAYVPQAEALIDVLDPSLVVYHCVDDLGAYKGIDTTSVREIERRFAGRADLVLASSPPLARRMRELSSRVVEVPNVADTALFSEALEAGPVDSQLAALDEPRIVFTGAISATKLDFDLLRGVARMRPEWTLALVGPLGAGDPTTDVSDLARLENVHLLGARGYDELPGVLRGAAAGIIPYVLSEYTASVFPMKVYEYLAAGLPVVSTPLPSLEGTRGVAFASDAPDTVTRLDELLAADSPEQRAQRSALAAGHSWDTRIDEIAVALEQVQP